MRSNLRGNGNLRIQRQIKSAMREIKFRGKCIHSGEWVYGNYIHSKRFKGCSNEHRIHDQDTGIESDVIPETVGQYTGLKDKNGVDIYEGDLMQVYKPNTWLKFLDDVHEVRWNEIECSFGYFCIRVDGWVTTKNNLVNIGNNKHGAWCKVIGNIHDNPQSQNNTIHDDNHR